MGGYNSTILEYYDWTLCNNPNYNKYYPILLKDVLNNADKYKEVYNFLNDESSKKVLEDIVLWRTSRSSQYLVDAYKQSRNDQYFEPFLYLNKDEIFVDCGGYIGDSTQELVKYVGGVKKVFLYEADEKNLEEARKNCIGINIRYRSVGVGNCSKSLWFSNDGSSSSAFIEDSNIGATRVDIVAIDDDIPMNEKVSFIKMDIEGMELDALMGAQNHIKNDRPVLAICLYHKPEDIWKLPLYIRSIVGNEYRFYMRHYTMYHGETVFYAVPNERK